MKFAHQDLTRPSTVGNDVLGWNCQMWNNRGYIHHLDSSIPQVVEWSSNTNNAGPPSSKLPPFDSSYPTKPLPLGFSHQSKCKQPTARGLHSTWPNPKDLDCQWSFNPPKYGLRMYQKHKSGGDLSQQFHGRWILEPSPASPRHRRWWHCCS